MYLYEVYSVLVKISTDFLALNKKKVERTSDFSVFLFFLATFEVGS